MTNGVHYRERWEKASYEDEDNIVSEYIKELKSNDPKVRRDAAGTLTLLAEEGSKEAFEVVTTVILKEYIRDLKSNDVETRMEAATYLPIIAKLGSGEALEALIPIALQDKDSKVRATATWGLNKVLVKTNDQRIIEPLITALNDEDRTVRSLAVMGLTDGGSKIAVEPLVLVALKDKDNLIRRSAVIALCRIEDEKAIPALTTIAENDPDSQVRGMAKEVLRKYRNRVE